MNDLTRYLTEAFLPQEDDVIVLMPGGFKPATGAHKQLAQRYAELDQVSEVRIMIGPATRNGWTASTSLQIWKLLLQDASPKIKVTRSSIDNPLAAAYELIKQAESGTYALASSNKGADYDRVVKFVRQHQPGQKYHKEGVTVLELPIDTDPLKYRQRGDENDGQPISASTLRQDIRDKKVAKIKTSYPDQSPSTQNKLIKLLLTTTGISESTKKSLNEGGVFCEECWDLLKQVTPNHLKHKHKMTLKEYKRKHPLASTHSEELRQKLSANNAMHNPEHRARALEAKVDKYGSMEAALNKTKAAQTKLERYGDVNYNNPKSRMGDKNSAKRPEVRKKISEAVKRSYSPELIALRKLSMTERRQSDSYKERMYELGLMYRPGERVDKSYYTDRVRTLTQINFNAHANRIENASKRGPKYHLDHKLSIHEGYKLGIAAEVVAHPANLCILPKQVNESKGSSSSITYKGLLKDIVYYESLQGVSEKGLLTCGGAAGHMTHPYEDLDLTFKDIENMIEAALSGKVEAAQEKLDGQNFMMSYKDGAAIAARNKGHIKNSGATALSLAQVEKTFEGRGPIQVAFTEAIRDLEAAINKLSTDQRSKFFGNGSKFLNLEVLYPPTTNVVPYGATQLRLHNIRAYDQAGNVMGEDQEAARQFEGAIRQVQAENQKTFEIRTTNPVTIRKSADYDKQKAELLKNLKVVQKEGNARDSDTVYAYVEHKWREALQEIADQYEYSLNEDMMEALLARWIRGDRSTNLGAIKKQVDNKGFLDWLTQFDGKKAQNKHKEVIKPIETLFLRLGVYTLSNIEQLTSLNPDESVRAMKADLQKAIKRIKASIKTSDPDTSKTSLDFLRRELGRLKDLGGEDAILPTEGIVFKYNEKIYKLTGSFAPLNQILGYLRF